MQSLMQYLKTESRVIVHAGNQTIDTTDVLSGLMVDILKPCAIIRIEAVDGINHVTVDPNVRV